MHGGMSAAPSDDLDIFLVTFPGLEPVLRAEAVEKGFRAPKVVAGGVTLRGGWPEVWRANLELRGAGRVLVRLGAFRAFHLAQLAKRARRLAWTDVLVPGTPVRVEASAGKGSRIYHAGAAAERLEAAITEALGPAKAEVPPVTVKLRIDNDLCTVSLDTSGAPLHKRGHKEAVNKAPLRETMAALMLRACGFKGREPVVDPMCGSGTLVIEAAEIAAGLMPGRDRRFAFEQFAPFDADAWQALRDRRRPPVSACRMTGSDRDAGAVRMTQANAERAGVADRIDAHQCPVSAAVPPEGPPGLVLVNPPYGTRLGDRKALRPLYAALGETLRSRFPDWRVGLLTSEAALAQATGLPLVAGPTASHGGLRITLYRTDPPD